MRRYTLSCSNTNIIINEGPLNINNYKSGSTGVLLEGYLSGLNGVFIGNNSYSEYIIFMVHIQVIIVLLYVVINMLHLKIDLFNVIIMHAII